MHYRVPLERPIVPILQGSGHIALVLRDSETGSYPEECFDALYGTKLDGYLQRIFIGAKWKKEVEGSALSKLERLKSVNLATPKQPHVYHLRYCKSDESPEKWGDVGSTTVPAYGSSTTRRNATSSSDSTPITSTECSSDKMSVEGDHHPTVGKHRRRDTWRRCSTHLSHL